MESYKIRKLKQSYKSKLFSKAEELERLIKALTDANERQSSVIDELNEYLHKLSGSAGMYGYDDIADAANQAMHQSEAGIDSSLTTGLLQLLYLLEQHG